jgi:iron complex transport system substrate-binding protein
MESRPKIVSLHPNALSDLWRDIERVADALGVPSEGQVLIQKLQARMNSITERAQALSGPRPRIACIEWLDPLMAAGNWVPEFVERTGGINLFGEAGKHSPWMKWEELLAQDPDVIIAMPCGWDITRTRQEMSALVLRPGWSELRAVQSGRVYVVDGNQFFNRPGPRLIDSLQIMAEILHPEGFEPELRDLGWIPWTLTGQTLQEGVDYTIDPQGRWVFSRDYHLKRGYCCGSGCRHCPYPKDVPENSEVIP